MCSTNRGWGGGVGERQKESQIKVVKRRREGDGGVEWLTKFPTTERERKTDAERERERGREDENIYAVASVVRQGRLLSL